MVKIVQGSPFVPRRGRGTTILSALCLTLVLGCGSSGPEIRFAPGDNVLLGEPLILHLRNFPPNQIIQIRAETINERSELLASSASFRVDANGFLDVSASPPISGSYQNIDPAGLFWSMRVVDTLDISGSASTRTVTFKASLGDRRLAEASVNQWLVIPDVMGRRIREAGLVGSFFLPNGKGRHPALLILGGSDGGLRWQESTAKLLASQGYACLALAYFRYENLPGALREIPLDYFETAVAWLQEQPQIRPDRIGAIGYSKGGELVLLLASLLPDIELVIGFSASSVVWQGLGPPWQPAVSSWSHRGEPVPFLPFGSGERWQETGILSHLYEDSMINARAYRRAAIAVEKINGPILLLSGESDFSWPAAAMGERVVRRLRRAGFPHPYEHLIFPGAGHAISYPGYTPTQAGGGDGETAQATAKARTLAWQRMLGFLKRHLGAGTGSTK